MNEEHRGATLGYLSQRRGLVEAPAVFQLAEQRGGVHQGEVGQMELFRYFVAELIPDTGIAAVLDETDAADAGR